MDNVKILEVKQSIFASNDEQAAQLRQSLKEKKIFLLNLMSAPGSGKTTTAGKLARLLTREMQKKVLLVAGDVYRPAAIDQLEVLGKEIGVPVHSERTSINVPAIAASAVDEATRNGMDVVLIDTAGRMQTNSNLIEEMKKIVRIAKPDLKVFVGDSLAGNDAIEQARVFDKAIGIDAIILTKIDTDAKGGAALSIAHTINKPIAFVCNGQEYGDIVKFDTEWMIQSLFGDE